MELIYWRIDCGWLLVNGEYLTYFKKKRKAIPVTGREGP
jgi:hypothetical protein